MNWKSIRKVRTAIRQDFCSDLKPLDYAIWDVLENKTKATSHPNIGLLKIAIKEKWNKMSKEFILKVCKLFQRLVDTMNEKNGGHIK